MSPAEPGGLPPCRPDWVAVDGPAGAGKSTLARALARALGWHYIDTGATYRAAALVAVHAGLNPEREVDWPVIAQAVRQARIELGTDPAGEGPMPVWLNGADVSGAVRSPEVSRAASAVARIPQVRWHLSRWQRSCAHVRRPCVMDGRDIGTVVLPEACVKLYVTASLEERARRRALELEASGLAGSGASLEEVQEQIRRRDLQDSTRPVAPLAVAQDAVVLETTGLDPAQVLGQALEIIRRRLGRDVPRSTGSPAWC